MKTLMAIMMVTLIAAAQSSGREPGAAMSDALGASEAVDAVEQLEGGCSGLPPGALIFCVAEAGPSFATIDIIIDPKGQPLGAYQIEMVSRDTEFSVVGVEAGEYDAFDHGRPPYFDPVAQQDGTDRLIIAEYAKPDFKAEQLPTQAIRIATVHVMLSAVVEGEAPEPLIQLKLIAAGNADGERIEADVSYSFRTPERPE